MNTSEKIRQLNIQGLSIKEISMELGIRYQFVYNVLHKDKDSTNKVLTNKVPTNKEPKQKEVDDKVYEYLRTTRFPPYWKVYVKSVNGIMYYHGKCPKKYFPHITQEWNNLESVIEEGSLIVWMKQCRCM